MRQCILKETGACPPHDRLEIHRSNGTKGGVDVFLDNIVLTYFSLENRHCMNMIPRLKMMQSPAPPGGRSASPTRQDWKATTTEEYSEYLDMNIQRNAT